MSESPSLDSFNPWKIRRPEDGIVYLYRSSNDGFWRVINDEDFALQEATGYPVGELVEQERMGDHDEADSGEIIAVYVSGPVETEPAVEHLRCGGCDGSVTVARFDGRCYRYPPFLLRPVCDSLPSGCSHRSRDVRCLCRRRWGSPHSVGSVSTLTVCRQTARIIHNGQWRFAATFAVGFGYARSGRWRAGMS